MLHVRYAGSKCSDDIVTGAMETRIKAVQVSPPTLQFFVALSATVNSNYSLSILM
ncbi:hypothetical protein [Bartonella sp. LJL80]